MPVTVRQIRFPTRVRYGLVGGPGFMTQRVVTGGGFVYKNAQWSRPLRRFQVDTANLRFDQWEELNAFILGGAFGPLHNFRLRDWTDYQCVTQPFGTGDGSAAAFQLTKTYTVGAFSHVRDITHPCGNLAGDVVPSIFVDGILESASNYTIDYASGIVTFTGGNEPAGGEDLTWSGDFDVPVELDDDYSAMTYEDFEVVNAKSITMTEVRVA